MTPAALRPIDLARAAGLSTQRIRQYADDGILPPAPRTASGYRRFDTRHRQALLAYRALALGYGWEPARKIMRAVHAGDLPLALTLIDAGHAELHEQRQVLQATGQALEAVAGQVPDKDAPRSGMRIGQVAGYLGVRTSALRVWEHAGLLTPGREAGTGYRLYGPADVRDARMIAMLRRGRHPFPQIRQVLDGLRRTGSSDALRAAVAQRRAELTARATAMLEGAALLHQYVSERNPGTADREEKRCPVRVHGAVSRS